MAYGQIGRGNTVGSFIDSTGKSHLIFETDDNETISYVLEPVTSFKNEDFTLKTWPKKTKILLINNIKSFDSFTRAYSKFNKKKKTMYINWAKVAEDFRGFYLDGSKKELLIDRYDVVPFYDSTINSWWKYEYDAVDVLIFD